jgi:hypothetical protein
LKQVVKKEIENYIDSKYYIEDIHLPSMICNIPNVINKTTKRISAKAFQSGMMVSSVLSKIGWNIVNNVSDHIDEHGLPLRSSHNYVYKDVDIVPRKAILDKYHLQNGETSTFRMLKDRAYAEIKSIIHITRLYIDLNTFKLYAIGYHPNVSGGNVCMGDLDGKVSFANKSMDEVKEIVQKLEDLLETVNYTSAYCSNGREYYSNPRTSIPVAVGNVSGDVSVDDIIENKNKHILLDRQTTQISSDDFEEDDESSTSETTEMSSDDFEEAADCDELRDLL